jgi:pimeloyl-ACP methyl ester carboxylesterase
MVNRNSRIYRRLRPGRLAAGAAAGLAALYLLICVLLYCFQASLAFPGSFRQGTANARIHPPPGTEMLRLTSPRGFSLAALFGKAQRSGGGNDPAASSRPTVLYFYGNGDALPTSLYHFDLFRRLGANCIIVDYEGFGMSGGRPSEEGCYAAAEAAYQYLLSRTDIDPKKLIPAGFSLGGAVAIDLAHRHRDAIAGLITLSTFTSMREEAARAYPWIPITWLLSYRFDSERKAADLTMPYFAAHGAKDVNIPPDCTMRLAAAATQAGARVTRYLAPEGTHLHFFDRGETELSTALKEFLRQF